MKKIFLLFTISLFLTQCDDGDFDEPSFVFENNINECGDLIIYNIGVDNSEALILNVDFTNTDGVFYTTERENETFNLSNRISYRVFDGIVTSSYFCQNIPPTSPKIVNQWNGSGTLIVNNTIILNDNDGVEELDYDLDTDGDEISDYLDIDDDNDGILTINEINDDGSFIDTDGDSIPNHLDNDDDGDSIPTLNEFETDSNGNTIVDYLDDTTQITQPDRTAVTNKHTLSYTTTFVIENMSLHNGDGNTINYSNFEFGVKTGDILITD